MRPPQRLSFGSSVLERWISATTCAVSSTGALCPGRLSPDALRHETGCKYRGIHAEMRNDEFQFSLVSPLFRLRARGPPLLPLLRLQPAQTAKTETLAMHPESPLRHAFFCVRRSRGRRGSTPAFRRSCMLSLTAATVSPPTPALYSFLQLHATGNGGGNPPHAPLRRGRCAPASPSSGKAQRRVPALI